jgi:hypothetical protein
MPCAASAFASATSAATTQANRYFSLHTARISVVPYRSSMGWTAIRTDLLFMDIVFDDPGVGFSKRVRLMFLLERQSFWKCLIFYGKRGALEARKINRFFHD